MTKQEAKELVTKHGSVAAAAKAAGMARSTLRDRLRGAPEGKTRTQAPTAQPGRPVRTLAEFRATYDKATIVPAKVRAAIQALGPSGWEYEVDFAKAAGVSLADLGRFRDQFADFVVQIGRDSRRAWAGSRATASAMREML